MDDLKPKNPVKSENLEIVQIVGGKNVIQERKSRGVRYFTFVFPDFY